MIPARSTGWRLILSMAAVGAVVAAFFIFILFNTALGSIFPDLLKLWCPIACWLITLVFLIMHRTRDGEVVFKMW